MSAPPRRFSFNSNPCRFFFSGERSSTFVHRRLNPQELRRTPAPPHCRCSSLSLLTVAIRAAPLACTAASLLLQQQPTSLLLLRRAVVDLRAPHLAPLELHCYHLRPLFLFGLKCAAATFILIQIVLFKVVNYHFYPSDW
ncbi:hypothetical protein ACOSQ2_028891 [Xanthoceras sorbifolium]